ncbi:metallophosphoesterase [Candidatus Woesearchaeota archaeon]|nr:metallophosphoesterase [Candidatus Woesearchaeota archaeon]
MVENLVAIVSDIHANYEALRAVLKDIQSMGVTRIINAGDLFGYGPDPIKCFDIAKTFSINIDGNHEDWTRLQQHDINIPLSAIHKRAAKSINCQMRQLYGKQKQKTDIGRIIELPSEKLKRFLRSTYPLEIIKEELEKHKDALHIPCNQRKKVRLDKTVIKLNASFLNETFTNCPDLYPTLEARIRRRNKAVEIYNFLEKTERQKTYELGNSLVVHDDPLNPGSGLYTIDDETAKRIGIHGNRASFEKINHERFPKKRYVFVGHTHCLPGIFDRGVLQIVYIGSVGFPRERPIKSKYKHISFNCENPENLGKDVSIAYYTAVVLDENRVIETKGRGVAYDNRPTRKKTRSAGLDEKIII